MANYKDFLDDIRAEHAKKYDELHFGDGLEHHVGSYFNGWAQVTAFVNATFGFGGVQRRIGKSPYGDKAKELAKKLSDLYFEYHEPFWNNFQE